MASGVPIVVTDTCPWEEVESIGCGYSIPQRSDAIAGALVRLLSDAAAATAMGDRGRAAARARYDWDAIARSMIEHYARAIAGARAGSRP
jgi:glycosyltransferase involved in cell wall biosynthesis